MTKLKTGMWLLALLGLLLSVSARAEAANSADEGPRVRKSFVSEEFNLLILKNINAMSNSLEYCE